MIRVGTVGASGLVDDVRAILRHLSKVVNARNTTEVPQLSFVLLQGLRFLFQLFFELSCLRLQLLQDWQLLLRLQNLKDLQVLNLKLSVNQGLIKTQNRLTSK